MYFVVFPIATYFLEKLRSFLKRVSEGWRLVLIIFIWGLVLCALRSRVGGVEGGGE